MVSVCIPVRNGEEYVADQLAAISRQDYAGDWEVVVADDGSTDRTSEIVNGWTDAMPLTVVRTGQQTGPNASRNRARAAARGDFIAFCDADDVASPGWITGLVAAAEDFDVVAGVVESESLNDPIVRAWKGDRPRDRLVTAHGFLPTMIGASCGMWGEVFDALGGFDPDVSGVDDIEMAWRAQLAGYTLGLAPDALVAYRYRPTLRALARQSFQRYRPVPSLLARYDGQLPPGPRRTSGESAPALVVSLLAGTPKALVDPAARGRWVRQVSMMAGFATGLVELRLGRARFGPEAPSG
ncbi:MAG: glycosyltransferase [Acidimicrobiales bacterium]|nr:glycosyltransferase [Acidimicrobiales bacterium]